jgi:hypothetical protein
LWAVPWDLDLATPAGAGFTQILSDWDDLNADCSVTLSGGLSPQMPTTCDKLQRGFSLTLRERVKHVLMDLSTGPLSEASIDARIAPWVEQLKPVVREANRAGLSEPTVATWKTQVQALSTTLLQLRDAAMAHAQE